MSDHRRRRTFSDSGIHPTPFTGPGPSPLSNVHKRRPSNSRTARLVLYPINGPPPGNLQGASSMPNVPIQSLYPQPYINSPTNNPMQNYQMYQMNSMPQMRQPQQPPNMSPMVTQMPIQSPSQPQAQQSSPFMSTDHNSICFPLMPQRQAIFEFNLERSVGQTVSFSINSGVDPITFILNGTHFTCSNSPIDVTAATKKGANVIQFSPTFSQAMAQMTLGPPVDIDSLVQRVIQQFGPPPPVNPDPFTTMTCPITNSIIVNAGRGQNCNHAQCFDLKSYIQRGIETNQWICPICQQNLEYEALRYDPNYVSNGVSSNDGNTNQIFDDFLNSDQIDGLLMNEFV